jgi:hypothetical protein
MINDKFIMHAAELVLHDTYSYPKFPKLPKSRVVSLKLIDKSTGKTWQSYKDFVKSIYPKATAVKGNLRVFSEAGIPGKNRWAIRCGDPKKVWTEPIGRNSRLYEHTAWKHAYLYLNPNNENKE